MTQKAIALLARTSEADVSHYAAGRLHKIGTAARARIEAVYSKGGASQTKVIEYHLEKRGSLTPLYASVEYGILRLSERVREINKRWHRLGERRYIRNTQPVGVIGCSAEYVIETIKEKSK